MTETITKNLMIGRASALRPSSDDKTYDVIVVGGGASGLIAALAAAKQGARVLLIERAGCLGGTGTNSMVAQWLGFFHGETRAVGGIPLEYANRVIAAQGSPGFIPYTMAETSKTPLNLVSFPFNPEIVKYVADEMVLESGIHMLLHCSVVDIRMEGNRIAGVAVETIDGKRIFRAHSFVDASGDAIVAHHAGAPLSSKKLGQERMPMSLLFRVSNVNVDRFRSLPRKEKREIALRGISSGELFWDVLATCSTPGGNDAICLMSRISGLDGLKADDITRAELIGRQQVKSVVAYLKRAVPGFETCELTAIANRVGVRETRHLIGDYTLTEEDVISDQKFEDTIALGCGPLDIHGSTKESLRIFMPPAPFSIPMRTMICAKVSNLVVTGRAISATREANGATRHMATAMALGQAAGTLAALCASGNHSVHGVSHTSVQDLLRTQGALLDPSELIPQSGIGL